MFDFSVNRQLRNPLNNPGLLWTGMKENFLGSWENPKKTLLLNEEVHQSLKVSDKYIYNTVSHFSYAPF